MKVKAIRNQKKPLQEIVRGNELIAQYMGYVIKPHAMPGMAEKGFTQWRPIDHKRQCREPIFPYMDARDGRSTLEFHSSWNCLMYVIDEISNDVMQGLSIEEIKNTHKGSLFELQLAGAKIELVWQSVVWFIEWYNKKYEL